MQSNQDTGGKVTDLQVLRGISIVLVVLYHLSLPHTVLGFSASKPNCSFWLGVEIFFIISGYVVTLSLLKDGCNGPRFFLRRIFRLVPAMVLFLLFSCAIHGFIRGSDLPASVKEQFTIPTHNFLLQERSVLFGYFTLTSGPFSFLNSAMWSLSVEDQFYATVTLLCLTVAVLSRKSERAAKWCLLLVAGALYIGLLACRLSILFGLDIAPTLPRLVAYLLIWRFDFLALGVVLAFVARRVRGALRTYFQDCSTFLTAFLLLIPLGTIALCESQFQNPLTARALVGFAMPMAALCFGLLVLLAGENMAFPMTRGWIYRTMLHLGDRSYTIYLFHFPMLAVAWLLFFRFMPWALAKPIHYGIAQMVLVTALLLPLVEVVYRFVELPLMRVGKRLTHVAARGPGSVVRTLPIEVPNHEKRAAA